jgi:hypothetical protein
MKWIPYSSQFLNDIDEAYSTWLYDSSLKYPLIKRGSHYWSLSWLPNHLRGTASNDDAELLVPWKRFLLNQVSVNKPSVSLLPTSEEAMFATACMLVAADDLSFISVWSPTFLLAILTLIQERREEIARTVYEGRWPLKNRTLKKVPFMGNQRAGKLLSQSIETNALPPLLWPKLALISAWDTSLSKLWANQLRDIFTQCPLQGKGLWATEGVLSIPFQDTYPMAYTSHFYEFECLRDGEIKPSWELKDGDTVYPIFTTSSGLLRYKLNDQLIVTQHIDHIPCFEFKGRSGHVDMAGEKISHEQARQILSQIEQSKYNKNRAISIIARQSQKSKPYYVLLLEGKSEGISATQFEQLLTENHHYVLARELGQLDHAQVIVVDSSLEYFKKNQEITGKVVGQCKPEALYFELY